MLINVIIPLVVLAIYIATVIFTYWANRRYSLMSGRKLGGGDVVSIFIPIVNVWVAVDAMNSTPNCRTFTEIFYRIDYSVDNKERRTNNE